MKNVRKHILYAIAFVIAGLVMTSAASVSITITSPEKKETNAEFTVANCQPISAKTLDISKESVRLGSVQVTSGDEDEYHPSVAAAPGGGFFGMTEWTEDGVTWHPILMYSEDGTTWDALVEFLYDNAEYTEMDQNELGTYGTFGPSPDSGGEVIVIQGEITDGWVWDFGDDGFDELSYNRIACYNHEGPEGDPGEWNWGGLTLSGYNNYDSADDEGCPFIFYQVSGAGMGVIGWLNFEEDVFCKHTGDALDLVTNMHYAVYDYEISGDDDWDLLVRKDDFGLWVWHEEGEFWYHGDSETWSIEDDLDLTYPSAAASNDDVIVACQKGDDVVVYYSHDGFGTVFEVPVEESASYPEVVLRGKRALITYIKDGVLYYRTSSDAGESWSDAEVVSDNQVNLNDRAAHIEDYGGLVHGIWEDTRGDNIDIYFDFIYEIPNDPPSAPDIDGPSSGKPGKTYDYTFNSVDPDEDIVRYVIDWGDDTSTATDYSPSGTDVEASHSWEEEKTYTITAKAQDLFGVFGDEATFDVEMPRSKAVGFNSLFLQFLQQFANEFSILRHILGL